MPDHFDMLVLAQEPPASGSQGASSAAQPGTKHYSPEQRQAVKHWAVWTGGMILGVMIIAGVVLVMLDRHRRQIMRVKKPKKRAGAGAGADAWAESAKRLDPAAIGSRDDTVDIDPDELGPHDIEEGGEGPEPPEPFDPHGEGGGGGRWSGGGGAGGSGGSSGGGKR